MSKKSLWVAVLLSLLPNFIKAKTNNKKEEQAMMQTAIEVLQKGESIRDEMPDFLKNDEAAMNYCRDVLSRSDEQYSADTASAQAFINEIQWLASHAVMPEEKVAAKLVKQKYEPEKLLEIYDWTNKLLYDVLPRHATLTSHCEKQLQIRRTALQQTMPEGKLVSLFYEERGNHLPVLKKYLLQRDSASGQWQLNGHLVPDEVAEKVRQLAEENKTYQCFSDYLDVPYFSLRGPELLGGPPAWSFSLRFEGGSIDSRSDNQRVPMCCCDILDYLENILTEI